MNESYLHAQAIKNASLKLAQDFDSPVSTAEESSIERKVNDLPKAMEKLQAYADLVASGEVQDTALLSALIDAGNKANALKKEAVSSGFGEDGNNFRPLVYMARHKQFWGLSKSAAIRPSLQNKKASRAAKAIQDIIASFEIFEENYEQGLEAMDKAAKLDPTNGAKYRNGFLRMYLNLFEQLEPTLEALKEKLGDIDPVQVRKTLEESEAAAETEADEADKKEAEEDALIRKLTSMVNDLEDQVESTFKSLEEKRAASSEEELQSLEATLKEIVDGSWAPEADKMERLGVSPSGKFSGTAMAKQAAGEEDAVEKEVLDIRSDMLMRLKSARDAIRLQGGQAAPLVEALVPVYKAVLTAIAELFADSAAAPATEPTLAAPEKDELEALMDDLFGERNTFPKAMATVQKLVQADPQEVPELATKANQWRAGLAKRLQAYGLSPDGTYTPPQGDQPLEKTAFKEMKEMESLSVDDMALSGELSALVADVKGYWKSLQSALANPSVSDEKKSELSKVFKDALYGESEDAVKKQVGSYYAQLKSKGTPPPEQNPEEENKPKTEEKAQPKKEEEAPKDKVEPPADTEKVHSGSRLFDLAIERARTSTASNLTIMNDPVKNKAKYLRNLDSAVGNSKVRALAEKVESALEAIPAKYRQKMEFLDRRSVANHVLYKQNGPFMGLVDGFITLGGGGNYVALQSAVSELVEAVKPENLEEVLSRAEAKAQREKEEAEANRYNARTSLFSKLFNVFSALLDKDSTRLHVDTEGASESVIDPMSGLLIAMGKVKDKPDLWGELNEVEEITTSEALDALIRTYSGGTLKDPVKALTYLPSIEEQVSKIWEKKGDKYALKLFPAISAEPLHRKTKAETLLEKEEAAKAEAEAKAKAKVEAEAAKGKKSEEQLATDSFAAIKKALTDVVYHKYQGLNPAKFPVKAVLQGLSSLLFGQRSTQGTEPTYDSLVKKGQWDKEKLPALEAAVGFLRTGLPNVAEIQKYSEEEMTALQAKIDEFFPVDKEGRRSIPAFPGYTTLPPVNFTGALQSGGQSLAVPKAKASPADVALSHLLGDKKKEAPAEKKEKDIKEEISNALAPKAPKKAPAKKKEPEVAKAPTPTLDEEVDSYLDMLKADISGKEGNEETKRALDNLRSVWEQSGNPLTKKYSDILSTIADQLQSYELEDAAGTMDELALELSGGVSKKASVPDPTTSEGRVILAFLAMQAAGMKRYKVQLDPHFFKGSKDLPYDVVVESDASSPQEFKSRVRSGALAELKQMRSALRSLLAHNMGRPGGTSGLVFKGSTLSSYPEVYGRLKAEGHSSEGARYLDILTVKEEVQTGQDLLRKKEEWESSAPKQVNKQPFSPKSDGEQQSLFGG